MMKNFMAWVFSAGLALMYAFPVALLFVFNMHFTSGVWGTARYSELVWKVLVFLFFCFFTWFIKVVIDMITPENKGGMIAILVVMSLGGVIAAWFFIGLMSMGASV